MTPELVERELGMNLDLIRKMHQAATAKGVAFAVVLFADFTSYPAAFVYGLGTSQIPTIDLTRLPLERYVHDHHPNPVDHRRMVEAIAKSPLTPMLDDAVRDAAGSQQ